MRSLFVGVTLALIAAEPPPLPIPSAVTPSPPATMLAPVPLTCGIAGAPPPDASTPADACCLPFATAPGWLWAFEVGGLTPHLHGVRPAPPGLLTAAPAAIPGFNVGGLDSVGSGRFTLGRRFDGWGEVTFSARFAGGEHKTLLVQGDPAVAELLRRKEDDDDITIRPAPPGAPGSSLLTTRFDLGSFDLGVGRHEDFLGPLWDLRWQAGGRAGYLFTDDRHRLLDTQVQAASHFAGVGPALDLGMARVLGTPGPGVNLAAFARAGGSVLFGQSQVTFREDVAGLTREGREGQSRAVPTAEVEAGLGFWRGERPGSRVMVGYRYERWWGVGTAGGSRLDLTMHGLFLRLEANF